MKKQLFDKLVDSIKEAVQIHRGEVRASREFVFDTESVVVPESPPKSESDTAD